MQEICQLPARIREKRIIQRKEAMRDHKGSKSRMPGKHANQDKTSKDMVKALGELVWVYLASKSILALCVYGIAG